MTPSTTAPPPDDRRPLGARAEQDAADRLTASGWTILERNWRHRRGELDIVARDGDTLVFVEVRSRRGARFGSPEESVDARKQARLVALAQGYVAGAGWSGPWRIDVVAVNVDAEGAPLRWAHYRNAVGF
ncbi:MAG: YraN family protein [Ardenticatenales bacterium]